MILTTTKEKMNLDAWDISAVVVYFVAVMVAGLVSMCRSNRGTVDGYFLAGRFMTWLPVGASLFASNIGSEHFIGLAGSGAAAGIGVGAFEFNACILLQLLGWVFLPVYIASGVCTLPEYMMRRFGGRRIQVYLAVLSLILYILTKISVNLYSGSLFIREALGWNIWFAILLLLGMTAVVTITGGLAAVMYTDTLQCFVMIIGAIVLTILSFIEVGGYSGLKIGYGKAVANETLLSNTSCGMPSEKAFLMLRPLTDKEMPWLGFLLGQTPASIWYWCADQMMVQRALASKSLSHARGGTLVAGTIKLLPMFIMVMPGMISRVIYPEVLACSTPESCYAACGQRAGCTNLAYPKLVMGLMPSGLRGVMLAVMLAALMSDLTSIFNSASTLFTVDIYRLIRRNAENRELMIVGRIFVIVMIGISILWIPVILEMQGGQLYIYIQMVVAYLAPPIAAVYVVAVLWKRGNEKGAFGSLMYGFVLGIVRLSFDFVWREPLCGEVDHRPVLFKELHYMYFALFSFMSSVLVNIVISLCTDPPTEKQLEKTTCWTLHRKSDDREAIPNPGIPERSLHDNFIIDSALEKTSRGDVEMRAVENDHMLHADDVEIVRERGIFAACRRMLIAAVVWFCGMKTDKSDTAKISAIEKKNFLRVTSLKQDPRAKLAENIYLVILVTFTSILYIIFSVPSSLTTGSYTPLNRSLIRSQ